MRRKIFISVLVGMAAICLVLNVLSFRQVAAVIVKVGPGIYVAAGWGRGSFFAEVQTPGNFWPYFSTVHFPLTNYSFSLQQRIGIFGTWNQAEKGVGVPPWAIAAILLYSARRAYCRKLFSPGMCAQCGYDLRATPDRCPECGTVQSKPAAVQ